MWKVAFVIVLAVGQVPAAPQEKYHSAGYPENVRSGPDSRILSGWDARPGQFPHHAALRLVDAAGGVSGCGGSIISREWVVSAAHCTASRVTLVVRAGVVNLINPQYIAETTEWYNHPTFNDNLPQVVQPNDIALIKLTRPVTYSDVLKPIRVQPSADAFRNYEGTVTIASGHGLTWSNGVSTEVLQWVYLRAIANNVCFSTYGSLITANSICTSFFNVTSQSTCHGDSGGPLIYTGDDGEPTLIGVASFVAGGDWGCHSGLPAGFIRPGPFLSWFTQITGIDYENLEEEEETTTTSTTITTTTTTTTEAPTTVPEPETTVTVPETTVTEPQTTVTVPTTTPKPKPPTTPAPEKPDSGEETEESEEDSSEESDEDADPELSELLKKLEVLVKVKVKMSKHGVSHHHHHHHNKTISIRH